MHRYRTKTRVDDRRTTGRFIAPYILKILDKFYPRKKGSKEEYNAINNYSSNKPFILWCLINLPLNDGLK